MNQSLGTGRNVELENSLQGQRPTSNQSQQQDEVKRKEQQEIVKNTILSQIMDKSALARLSNLATVKPEKSQAIENHIIQMARTGQIRGKMTDDDLRRLLDQIAGQGAKTTKVKYDRRRAAIDSDEEEETTTKDVNTSDED